MKIGQVMYNQQSGSSSGSSDQSGSSTGSSSGQEGQNPNEQKK